MIRAQGAMVDSDPFATTLCRLVVLRGKVGVGKTAVLRALAAAGGAALDLEALAAHRGSAFGGAGLGAQPSHRTFQERLIAAWRSLEGSGVVFVEHEGPYVGSVGLPPSLVTAIDLADGVVLSAPDGARVDRIIAEYGAAPVEDLFLGLRRVERRLGKHRFAAAWRALERNDLPGAVRALLPYYDAAYSHQIASAKGATLAVVETGGRAPGLVASDVRHLAAAPA